MLPLVVLGGAWPGMVTVETIGRIRRAFLVDHKPIRQIVRELRISRKTVRKAIRGSSTEFRYERGVQPQPRLGEFVGRVNAGEKMHRRAGVKMHHRWMRPATGGLVRP